MCLKTGLGTGRIDTLRGVVFLGLNGKRGDMKLVFSTIMGIEK